MSDQQRPWFRCRIRTPDGREGIVDQDAGMAAPVEVRVMFPDLTTAWFLTEALTVVEAKVPR